MCFVVDMKMSLTSKRGHKVVVVGAFITALIFSRILLGSFDDPEGPNLFVVMVMTLGVIGISMSVYFLICLLRKKLKHVPSAAGSNIERFCGIVLLQIVLVIGFYVCLK